MKTLKKHHQTLIFCLFLFTGACQQKHPPIRQYLVLSALEHSLINAQKSSDQALEALKKDVRKSGNSREGRERIKRAELLRKKTTELIGDLEKPKHKLIVDAGQGLDAKTHYPKRPLNIGTTTEILKEIEGELSKRLNGFSEWIGFEYKDLDLPRFELLGAGHQELSFYATYFDGANLGEALATLTQFQHHVIRYQREVLKKLGAGGL